MKSRQREIFKSGSVRGGGSKAKVELLIPLLDKIFFIRKDGLKYGLLYYSRNISLLMEDAKNIKNEIIFSDSLADLKITKKIVQKVNKVIELL